MADSHFLLKNETHQIIGSAMEVLNEIGHGFHEKIHEHALVAEFGLRGIPVIQQPDFPVIYKSVNVGVYVPDLICFGLVVVDAKTIEEITDHEIEKMLNYQKVTNLQVGLLVNFNHAKLEFKRVVRSRLRRQFFNRRYTQMNTDFKRERFKSVFICLHLRFVSIELTCFLTT